MWHQGFLQACRSLRLQPPLPPRPIEGSFKTHEQWGGCPHFVAWVSSSVSAGNVLPLLNSGAPLLPSFLPSPSSSPHSYSDSLIPRLACTDRLILRLTCRFRLILRLIHTHTHSPSCSLTQTYSHSHSQSARVSGACVSLHGRCSLRPLKLDLHRLCGGG